MTSPDLADAAEALVQAGRRLDARGWAPASAGNYSCRLGDGTIAITVSGAHKGRLDAQAIMRVDAAGQPLEATKPSAETLLHALIYELAPAARAVLHTHSVAGTVLSRAVAGGGIALEGYELLKVYPGLATHEVAIALPLVDNSQDMVALAAHLRARLGPEPALPAFYIRGHGLYAWGASLAEAENVAEGSEFLLACAWEELKLKGRAP